MNKSTVWKIALVGTLFLAFAVSIIPHLKKEAAWDATETLNLHLYSNRYDINSMGAIPAAPRDWQCIATVSVVSGYPFYFNIPCHYEPEMRIEGMVTRFGDRIESEFTIDVADVGPAYHHEQKSPIALNTLYEFGDEDFKFSISDSPDPAVIPLNK